VVDEERMRPGHWLGLVLCVSFSALMLIVGLLKVIHSTKKHVPLIPRGSIQEQVEGKDLRGTSRPRFTWKMMIKQK